ncbi:MAG: BON domain-containing protein [Janthinobacterium lividum]
MAPFSLGQSTPLRRQARRLAMAAMAGVLVLGTAGCAGTATKGTMSQSSRDAMVTARVQAALASDASLASLPIAVQTADGAVTLSGLLDSANQIAHAVAVTRDIDGVDVLRNDLHVKSH